MYVIREENGRIVYLNKEKTAFVLCENEKAADAAIKALERLFGIKCVSDKVDSAKSAGFWTLRRRDGSRPGKDVGARIVLPSRSAAENFSESIRLKTKQLMIPVPA